MQSELPATPLDPLPENAILVHLGPHKTGTTSIQSTLAELRAVLAEHNVHYPGVKEAHHIEARALVQRRQGWPDDYTEPRSPEVWKKFARDAASFPGRVVISSELLAEATETAGAQLVRDLDPSRVHIIIGARNPASIAMSTWQQVLRTFGRSDTLSGWLEAAFRRDGTESTNRFWWRVDTSALVARWLDTVPPERITVIALEEGDRRLLPATFEQLLGLPPGLLVDHKAGKTNRGLTAVELALIRRVNARLNGKLSWHEYSRLVRGPLLTHLITTRSPGPDESKVSMPRWALEQARTEAERNIEGLRASGVRIAGDLGSLRNIPVQAASTPPSTQVPVELAVEAVVGAVLASAKNQRKLRAKLAKRPKASASKRGTESRPAGSTSSLKNVSTRRLMSVLARRLRKRSRRARKKARRAIGRTR